MPTHVDPPAATMDEARRELCQRLAEAIREGGFGIQVRLLRVGQMATEAWVYVRREHEWQKRDDLALSANLAELVQELLEHLATREYADAWSCHRTDHSDRIDFELKFHRESIEPHLTGDLAAYLNGLMFHGHHDSGKDARRRIRFQGH